MRRMVKNKEWKHSGMGAVFRGDTMSEVGMDSETRVDAYINSVHAAGEDKVLYTFTVNQTSGVIERRFPQKRTANALFYIPTTANSYLPITT